MELKYDAAGLIPVVVQDQLTGQVRMVAWMNAEALARTREEGEVCFYSRSRQALWRKGETSGNTLALRQLAVDCDGDTLLALVDPRGPSCHTGEQSCFYRALDARDDAPIEPRPGPVLEQLSELIGARARASAETSYTRRLLDGGPEAIAAKLQEEAAELSQALASESEERVASEAADVLYHLMVGLELRGVPLCDVLGTLGARLGVSGLVEKASRGT
ncbi:MAG: bifunctional phosphoribosyl-AMP cyclohydrolase/phosphoribosyl-ATP diphosphatase HisIE [Polyangiaceae bacterium]|nr:bifunctional phosphoribosyl-AMP cyclohydrolase/phosphoribosyl-ATP diphosphatase HisIE [Polyangiaceae bacterium]MCW5792438.1 bifunctional phosphoribosyl-AMP cyclohydrolase/phosphoribosyl-ATP diphosphatase HisIE [Polyangiaceae bacterium]